MTLPPNRKKKRKKIRRESVHVHQNNKSGRHGNARDEHLYMSVHCADYVGDLQESGLPDLVRLLGAVPVTGSNLYKLMAAHEAVLLLPGGLREAVKRKV